MGSTIIKYSNFQTHPHSNLRVSSISVLPMPSLRHHQAPITCRYSLSPNDISLRFRHAPSPTINRSTTRVGIRFRARDSAPPRGNVNTYVLRDRVFEHWIDNLSHPKGCRGVRCAEVWGVKLLLLLFLSVLIKLNTPSKLDCLHENNLYLILIYSPPQETHIHWPTFYSWHWRFNVALPKWVSLNKSHNQL